MKWTIREMLFCMFLVAIISGFYWNQQHGRMQFNLWTIEALSVLGVPLWLYRFARRRQIMFLLAGIACTCIAVYFGWLIANGQFK